MRTLSRSNNRERAHAYSVTVRANVLAAAHARHVMVELGTAPLTVIEIGDLSSRLQVCPDVLFPRWAEVA